MSASLILLIAACVYLAIGVPVAFALGLSTITALLVSGNFPLIVLLKETFTGIDSFPLMAVPFFILAAELMSGGSLTEVLSESSQRVQPHCPHFGLHAGACGGCVERAVADGMWIVTGAGVGVEGHLLHLERARGNAGGQFRVAQRQDARGQQAGVGGVVHGHRGHGHAAGHLHDRQQRVHALQMFRCDRHAEHGQRGHGRGHAREVRRAAGKPAEGRIRLEARHSAGILQITVADVRDGALSGSTLKEANSWGKVDTAYEQMVYCEATIAVPLIVGYAFHKGAWRARTARQSSQLLDAVPAR